MSARAKLSSAQAIQIFQIRRTLPTEPAAKVANVFGVNEKTVRDIWKGRTWIKETWHLDTSRLVVQKNIGRPKGARDSKPRMPKTEVQTKESVLSYPYTEIQSSRNEWLEVIERCTNFDSSSVHFSSQENQQDVACFLPSWIPTSCVQSKLPNQGASARSVDQQLHDWDQTLWLDLESADPFRNDWHTPQ